MLEHEHIQIRSEEVMDILGTPPSWIVRWGTTMLFFAFVLLCVASWIVKYPDKLNAGVTITTESPPVSVIARQTGYVGKWLVRENQPVKKGDILLVVQDAANYNDVLELDKDLTAIQSLDQKALANYRPDKYMELGELQPAYSAFVQLFEEFTFKTTRRFDKDGIAQLRQQIVNIRKSIAKDKENKQILEQQYALENQAFRRAQNRYASNAIDLADLEQAKNKVLNLQRQKNDIDADISDKEISINVINKQIIDIQQNTSEGKSTHFVRLIESINQLLSEIDRWETTFLVRAPTDGVVAFYGEIWSEQQNINEGDEILAIVPTDSKTLVGKLAIPVDEAGEVRTGQRVIIRLKNQNYEQLGVLEGRVEKIALLPKNNEYTLVISFPNGLTTLTGNEIPFQQQMTGTAEIITADRRFAERIFDRLFAFAGH